MASQVIWVELLDGQYPSYKIEVTAFLDSLDISSSTDVAMDYIYQQIQNDINVSDNLKLLYRETVFGSNPRVKARIKNRVSHFHRALK